jgi:Transposase, Mutator family
MALLGPRDEELLRQLRHRIPPGRLQSQFRDRLYDLEIRKVICTTNAIESLNARNRRAVKARGHFPTEQAAMKCLYLVTRSLDPKGTGQTRWAMSEMEASPERVRHHLRRPHASARGPITMKTPLTPLAGQTPTCRCSPTESPSKGCAPKYLSVVSVSLIRPSS